MLRYRPYASSPLYASQLINPRPSRRNAQRSFRRTTRFTNIHHQPLIQLQPGESWYYHSSHRYLWTWLHQYPTGSWWMVKTRLESSHSRFIRWWSSAYWGYSCKISYSLRSGLCWYQGNPPEEEGSRHEVGPREGRGYRHDDSRCWALDV